MKSISTIFFVLCASCILTISIYAQDTYKTTSLVGSGYDLYLGVHSGIYDCNQSFDYPYNLGVFTQFNYSPEVMENFFMGVELGAFFAQGGENEWSMDNGIYIGHVSIYPGFSLPLAKRKLSEKAELHSRLYARKLRFAGGVTYGLPFTVTGYRLMPGREFASSGLGFSGMILLDIGSRMSLLLSGTRLYSDTDGLGFKPDGARNPGNLHDRSYWYKLGIAYNLVGY